MHALFFLPTRPHFSTGPPLAPWSFPTTCAHKHPLNPHHRTQPCGPSTWTKKSHRKCARKERPKAANLRGCKGTRTCLPGKPRGTKYKIEICVNFTEKSSSTFQQYPSLKLCWPQGGPWQNNLTRKAQNNTWGAVLSGNPETLVETFRDWGAKLNFFNFFFFALCPKEIQTKFHKRSHPAFPASQGLEQVLILP